MRLLLVGFGVVGQALARALEAQRAALYGRHAFSPRIVGVLDSRGGACSAGGLEPGTLLEAKRRHGTVGALPAHGLPDPDPEAFIAESGAEVMVEATPTSVRAAGPAVARLKAAFRSGMHVVCVNKGPLAVAFPALLELARHNRVEFRFSGTVGGGTPVLALAEECARGNEVLGLTAVLNGTTNFILWRMERHGEDFETALAEATRLGYAERDPSADVDGIDSATKLVILANRVLGRPCSLTDVSITGIRGVTPGQIEAARGRREVIRLIAEANARLEVAPRAVPADSPLHVPENLNALRLELRTGGPVALLGRGAGGPETATAILRDLIDIWHVAGGGR